MFYRAAHLMYTITINGVPQKCAHNEATKTIMAVFQPALHDKSKNK